MNCKPGDLARVVSNGLPMETPGLVDRIVEVLRPSTYDEIFISVCGTERSRFVGDTNSWVVRSANPLPWKSPKQQVTLFYEQRVILDSNLRPIGGVPVNDEVQDDIKEPA